MALNFQLKIDHTVLNLLITIFSVKYVTLSVVL